MVPFNWQLIFDGDRDVHWSVKNLSYDRNLTKRRIYTNHCNVVILTTKQLYPLLVIL